MFIHIPPLKKRGWGDLKTENPTLINGDFWRFTLTKGSFHNKILKYKNIL